MLYVTGSANMNNRSSYHDTELNVGVIDDTHTQTPDGITVATFAHEARSTSGQPHPSRRCAT